MRAVIYFHIVAILLALSTGCGLRAREGRVIPISEAVDNSIVYRGSIITIIACLNVTKHGMTLEGCNDHRDEVIFEASRGHENEYIELTNFGFSNIGRKSSDLPLRIEGYLKCDEREDARVCVISITSVDYSLVENRAPGSVE